LEEENKLAIIDACSTKIGIPSQEKYVDIRPFDIRSLMDQIITTQEEINVINNNGVTVIDIVTGKPKLGDNVTAEEMGKLNIMIENIIEEKQKYPKFHPKNKFEAYRSSFNTEA
jgi:hypothetical protein